MSHFYAAGDYEPGMMVELEGERMAWDVACWCGSRFQGNRCPRCAASPVPEDRRKRRTGPLPITVVWALRRA